MMVIVDTSVWVRFLANRAPFAERLDALLDAGDVMAHDMVEGELLIGDRGGRPTLLAGYEKLRRAPTVSHDDTCAFVRARKLHGRGIGWIDAHLLASSLLANASLWTADEALADIADELGIGYG
jgi:predicted nucleic acid-binding protein